MTDFPSAAQQPVVISSFSRYAAGYDIAMGGTLAEGAITWPGANRAIYIPIGLPFPYNVRSVFWGNGSTVTGNVDFGIYTFDGARIYSTTSTGQSGATALQFVTPSPDFILSAGRYYLAVLVSATTANLMRGSTTPSIIRGQMGGLLQEDLGSTALPTSMTPATLSAFCYPLCGISRKSSPPF